MPLQAIEQLLKMKMGLHSSTVGSSTINHAVEHRMRACCISGLEEYGNILRHSTTELNALIESVVIPETWFYRDCTPFIAFTDWLKDEWIPGNSIAPLRVLSIPCSTGEEPYTLAMCMADCGLPAHATQIHAIDISSTNIDKARKAEYGSNSFRGSDLAFRDKHFESRGPHYLLNENIRSRVTFEQVNILDEAFRVNRAPYHVIFCRNLLIYFDRPTQQRAIDRLDELLTEKGLLFLGHSETSLLLSRPFVLMDLPRSFGFRRASAKKNDKGPHRSRPTRRSTNLPVQARKETKPEPGPFADVAIQTEEKTVSAFHDQDTDLLQQAFQLADEGHLDEAADRCETLLQRKTHQADAHYLLGLIREAAGNTDEAAHMLRKAIYLDPNHYEALAHLSVICTQQGDTQSAQRLNERAARAQQRRQVPEAKT